MNRQLVILQSQTDQDWAECREWFQEASNQDLLDVWMAIQRENDDPAMEIMSRLAQLKFSEMYLKLRGAAEPTEGES